MKLYYVAHCRFPSERAHAIQIAKMAEAMRLSGTDADLIVPRRKNRTTEDPRRFYGLKTDLPVHYLPTLDLYAWGKIGYLVSGLSFLVSYVLYLTYRKLRSERFVLYTIDMDEFSFIGVSLLGSPFVMEIHGSKKYGTLLNRMFTRARAILTINNIIKRELVKNFKIPPENIVVYPNGIDIGFFSQAVDKKAWRRRWRIPPEASLALYVGKCYNWKGMEIFDEAIRKLPDITFAFVGCTREEIEQTTDTKHAYANALFFGERPYPEMPHWMKSADMLLVISTKKNEYSYYQTSPMKLFEYMASGVPILAADTPAIRDAVSSKEVFLYEPDNAQNFVRAIKEILRDTSRAQSIASHAHESARKFSWKNRAESIIAKLFDPSFPRRRESSNHLGYPVRPDNNRRIRD